MTLLRNSPQVINFKKELVRQFYAMRKELTARQVKRAALKPVRRELTDVLKDTGAGQWAYQELYEFMLYGRARQDCQDHPRGARRFGKGERHGVPHIHRNGGCYANDLPGGGVPRNRV